MRVVLFLDFDGTLVRFGRHPSAIRLGSRTRRLLGRLAGHSSLTLCVISGRRRSDLCRRVAVAGLHYLGMHGWERGRLTRSLSRARPILERARRTVQERMRGLAGVRVEDKGLAFVVHYRGAPRSSIPRARRAVEAAVKAFRSQIHCLPANKAWEILPREVRGKGPAVLRFLGKQSGRKLVIYVGDDTTDESAFAVLRSEITVRIGFTRRTRARFFLRNPAEVHSFLQKIESLMG